MSHGVLFLGYVWLGCGLSESSCGLWAVEKQLCRQPPAPAGPPGRAPVEREAGGGRL
jgi:hypothetical protein